LAILKLLKEPRANTRAFAKEKSIKFSKNSLVTPQSELDDWLDQIEKQL
jgi:hypothetical protein